ncbi:Phosphatidylinositol 4-phosphate 5-kinase 3 [Diplonema papillatum]|nr:Phosphatidylinositol 4-phosphate 5-kinase 3 [Diplonema papillatum]
MASPDEEVEEVDEQMEAIPEMWRYVSPSGDGAAGPLVGKLVRYLNQKEEEELLEDLAKRNPATGQSLLMWATLQQKFVLVEWLVKKTKRSAFAFSDTEKDLTIFDKFQEKIKEREQEEKERLEALAEAGDDAPPDEDEEEKEPPPPLHELVKADLGDEEGVDEFKIRKIGELGVYQGQKLADGTKEGLGQSLFPNGDMYIGEYRNNKRHGVGCYYWSRTEEIYIGQWKANLRSGKGRMFNGGKGRYYGMWANDAQAGKGRYTHASGDTYAGDFLNGEPEGHGTYTVAQDTSQLTGTFHKGKFLFGDWVLAGGQVYYGVFKDFKPIGKGVFHYKTKTPGETFSQSGEYLADGLWVPTSLAKVEHASPVVDISLLDVSRSENAGEAPKKTVVPVSYGSSGGSPGTIADLVAVANFTPLTHWIESIAGVSVGQVADNVETVEEDAEKPAQASGSTWVGKKLRVDAIEVVSVQYSKTTRKLQEAALKVSARDEEGGRWPALGLADPDVLVFTETATILAPVVRCGEQQALIHQISPSLASGSFSAASLMSVDILPDKTLSSPMLERLQAMKLSISGSSVLSINTTLPSSAPWHVTPEQGTATVSVLYFSQEVTREYWDALPALLQEVCPENGFAGLAALPLDDFARATQHAPSLAGAHLIRLLTADNRLPASTCVPMRPPTPPPPRPEPRPEGCVPLPEEVPQPPKEDPVEPAPEED